MYQLALFTIREEVVTVRNKQALRRVWTDWTGLCFFIEIYYL